MLRLVHQGRHLKGAYPPPHIVNPPYPCGSYANTCIVGMHVSLIYHHTHSILISVLRYFVYSQCSLVDTNKMQTVLNFSVTLTTLLLVTVVTADGFVGSAWL